MLWVTSTLSAGYLGPKVPGAVTLDDAELLSWLTSVESAGLETVDLDDAEPLAWLTSAESADLCDADVDAPESFSWLTSMESANLDVALLDIVEILVWLIPLTCMDSTTKPMQKDPDQQYVYRHVYRNMSPIN